MKVNRHRHPKLIVLSLLGILVALSASGQEWKLQTTVLSRLNYSVYPFRDSGWFAGLPDGLKIPLDFQIGLARIDRDTLVSLNCGLSLGVLPASQGYYSGATVGLGVHYNGELQGFYSTIYPAFDTLWIQVGQYKRPPMWQFAVDILGFEIDLPPVPIQVGAYLRASPGLGPSGLVTMGLDLGLTFGYHHN
jgi:hypothetical protein